jgi:hypothetical protein
MALTLEQYCERMNGDLFVKNDEGEADEGNPLYRVRILRFTEQGHDEPTMEEIVRTMASTIEHQVPMYTPRQKNLILGARMGAYRLGLLLPEANAVDHHCSYSEVDYVSCANGDEVPVAHVWMDYAFLASLVKQSTNLICLCAYFFRARGHHYKESFGEDIAAKWRKNLNAEELSLSSDDFRVLFTHGLHAIYPDVLDKFWSDSIDEFRVCRPFALRFSVPCAGTAPYFALYAGLSEAQLIMPGAFEKERATVDRLRALCDDLRLHRWKGGINRKYYGGAQLLVKETDFAALAAIVYGLNTPEDAVTSLGKALSLKRVADTAPLTTTVVRAAATGLIRRAAAGDVQSQLGDRALAKIVFSDEL